MLPDINEDNKTVRIICLIKDDLKEVMTKNSALMSDAFPSIWLNYRAKNGSLTIIGGFYREWNREGIANEADQIRRIEIFTDQMEKATSKSPKVLILGDANICAKKWNEDHYKHKKVADTIKNKLEECGMSCRDLGYTFKSDIVQKSGNIATSALDHIYISKALENYCDTKSLLNGATDHLPILASIRVPKKSKTRQKVILKRSLKNFTKASWKRSLASKEWEDLAVSGDINEMTNKLTRHVTDALDECAPKKRIVVKDNYKYGLSEKTKSLMKERDTTRRLIKTFSPTERIVQQLKYKKLRNKVNSQLKKDNININNERVKSADSENEIWKVVKDITNPKRDSNIVLVEDNKTIEDEREVAEIFNDFFIDKINLLKENIDQSKVEDPCTRLKEKMESKNITFKLKLVSEKMVLKTIKNMKNKKSSGLDEITQEQLKMGADILVIPLTKIINASIAEGVFPDAWKQGVVTPVLKKGSAVDKNNYRPVSCLSVLSKVLEKVVCNQITNYMEKNDLLPPNQHGFRAGRSTMTALTAIQQEWANNTAEKFITGVLLWDLSAAFDTLDSNILCKKLKIYGFDKLACAWFRSFLTGRSQRVKIGRTLSNPRELQSGVPQGGILSPIIFVIYGADMELWLKHSTALTYADDTSSSVRAKLLSEVTQMLEEDAENVLNFMASNGLVANPKKTTLLILNNKGSEEVKITIGGTEIKQVEKAKLLGVTIEDSQKWKNQISGKGGVTSALNTRLFLIKRLKNHIDRTQLRKVADSIWTSKLRYGLQLYDEVRRNAEDSKNCEMIKLQKCQNNLLRTLENAKIKDKRSIESLLESQKMLSVNQMQGQIKIMEMWKSKNVKNYPLKINILKENDSGITTRGASREQFRINQTPKTCIGDATRLWNRAPPAVQEAKSITVAKKESKKYCSGFPI